VHNADTHGPVPPEVDLGKCRVCVDVVAYVQDVVTLNAQCGLNLAAAAAAKELMAQS
jgi:hypothetical protein